MFRTLLVGVVALSAALFGGCSDEDIKKAEWAWVEKRKAAVEEMTGVYAGEMSQPEVEYSFYEREKGTAYFCPGEPKFSGYIGVYDRGAKTFQVSLRVKEIYNTKPQKIELDYAVLCSGKRK